MGIHPWGRRERAKALKRPRLFSPTLREAIEETKIAFSLGRGEDGASCDPVACEVPSDTEERTSTLVEGRNPDEGREGRLMALYTSLCRGPAKLLWDTTPKGQRRRG